MKFEVIQSDYNSSPFTGMTRTHWLDAAKFLLKGVFGHIRSFDDPILLPRQNEITYPKPNDPPFKFKAAEYEGLSRTFLAAAPVIADQPGFRINGYSIRDYYANQILQATDPKSPRYFLTISELIEKYGMQWYQHVVEGAALCIALMYCRSQLWDQFSSRQKDQIARFISDYAHNRTLGHNWRYFNVLMLTFLKLNDYPINETMLNDHLQHLLAVYTGDGWYRDDTRFDYYNSWAFHFYGALWAHWYGYDFEPDIAQVIQDHNYEFMKTYPLFFSREGHQHLWGRSIIYRCAASAAFGATFLFKKTSIDPGWARRIASGNLLQFLSRDDVFINEVPCLGYYGPFSPLVQSYSCSASPFWLSKIFVALTLPSDSPFWTAKENEGDWESVGENQRSHVLRGPGLTVTIHGATGASELRPGKVRPDKIFNIPPFYNRLAYNTAFLCESDSPQGATAMQYCIKELGKGEDFLVPNGISFWKSENDVLYRQLNLRSHEDVEGRIDLAEIIVSSGVIRVDRLRAHVKHELHLGHYGLPHLKNAKPGIRKFQVNGKPCITISAGNRHLALVAYHGWNDVDAMEHVDLNPEAETSTVIFARRKQLSDYTGMEILITIMLHKIGSETWTADELDLISKSNIIPFTATGQPCGAILNLRNSLAYQIDFGMIEGSLKF